PCHNGLSSDAVLARTHGHTRAMLQSWYAYWLAGKVVAPNHDLAIADKYSGAVVIRVAQADASAIDAGDRRGRRRRARDARAAVVRARRRLLGWWLSWWQLSDDTGVWGSTRIETQPGDKPAPTNDTPERSTLLGRRVVVVDATH